METSYHRRVAASRWHLLLLFRPGALRAQFTGRHLSVRSHKRESSKLQPLSIAFSTSSLASRPSSPALPSRPTRRSCRPGLTQSEPRSSRRDSTSASKRSYRRRCCSTTRRSVPLLVPWRSTAEIRVPERKIQGTRFVTRSRPDGELSPKMPRQWPRSSRHRSLMYSARPSPRTRR